ATSRRNPRSRARPSPHGGAEAAGRQGAQHEGPAVEGPAVEGPAVEGPVPEGPGRLPPVRLAPRDELAASARVAPLLRAARDVARWAGTGRRPTAKGPRGPPDPA